MNLHLSSIFVLISLAASLTLYFQKDVPSYLKLFPIFLAVAFIVERIGWYLDVKGISNIMFFGVFSVLYFEFYFYILRKIIQSAKANKVILYLSFIYPILFLLNIVFVQTHTFHSITYSLGCLLIVAVCIYYFYELFQLPKATNLIRDPAFWICSGLLFFYTCSFPLFGLLNLLSSLSQVLILNVSSILMFLNVLLYSLYTIAFLCRFLFRDKMHRASQKKS